MKIDPRFPCISPDSAAPLTIPLRLQLDELERELHQRRDHYPKRVDKGRMTAYDAERGIDMMRALVADMQDLVAVDRWYEETIALPPGTACPFPDYAIKAREARDRALAPFRWSELVACLQHEIGLRRRYYPQWIAAGTLEPMRARHQVERLEAVHFRWWVGMHHFVPDELWSLHQRIHADEGPEREALRQSLRLAHRAHRMLFDPSSDRGAYAAIEEQQEMAL